MSSVSYHIPHLLDKMTSTDKDLRFMATNDLMSELQKDSIKLDDDSERKVVRMILCLLEDKNGEVQNLAVKCLGPLVVKVKDVQVETVVDTLCNNMVCDKEQLRDISSIALKTVVNELPTISAVSAGGSGGVSGGAAGGSVIGSGMTPTSQHQHVASVCRRVIVQLCRAISMSSDVSVQLEALDIMADLLSRFGTLLVGYHASILDALLPQLASPRMAVRKRTIIALGYLVLSCSGELYQKLIKFLLDNISCNTDYSAVRTYINTVTAISREAGQRFSEHLETVLPLIVRHCQADDDELREQCLQALEAFVHKCPKEVTQHIPVILELCVRFLSYDPNYKYPHEPELDSVGAGSNGASADQQMDDDQDDEDEDQDDEDEQDYSDDEDMSWKVRRAAAKCLDSLVCTRRELLMHLHSTVSLQLIHRFKEREESVKTDIFHVYVSLLRQTKASTAVCADSADLMDDGDSPLSALQQQVPVLVRAIHRQLRERSIKTRQGCFTLLRELIMVLKGALTDHISLLMPGILHSLGERNATSNMKIDTLVFVHCLLEKHRSCVFWPHVAPLLAAVVQAVHDPFYKITAEALRVLQQLMRVLRPLASDAADSGEDVENGVGAGAAFDCAPFVDTVYQASVGRLSCADIDQEVKERAIGCVGQLLCRLGGQLQPAQLLACLQLLLERLRNEITRLVSVRALTAVAESSLPIDMRPVIGEILSELATFLRKNQRQLRLGSLVLLERLVSRQCAALSSSLNDQQQQELLRAVLLALPPLINDADLHVAQLALSLLTAVCQHCPVVAHSLTADGVLFEVLLPPVLAVTRSPLLQGAALRAVTQLLTQLVTAQLLPAANLLAMLLEPVAACDGAAPSVATAHAPLHKQAFTSISQCVAAVSLTSEPIARDMVRQLLAQVNEPSTGDQRRTFALLCLGEIGQQYDLSGMDGVRETVLSSFGSAAEDVKHAAAYCLGSVACGNLDAFVPFVLEHIELQPRRQYLLLHSLKEIITNCSQSHTSLAQHEETIWQRLFGQCESNEEGARNVVAECLGRLTLLHAERLLPRLRALLLHETAADRPLMRTTIVTAVKFTLCDRPHAVDALLRQCLGDFLAAVSDPQPEVRRVALVAFNSAAHNKPALVRDLLDTLLPRLYAETKVRKELIREVEMGPFKHTVDDGLDLRKAGYECMYTLLDSCLDRLDVFAFLDHVEHGLRDDYDIKILTHLMLVRLAALVPNAVLQRLDRLVEPLRVTCTTKVKQNSVKQEFEKQDELRRSALRVTVALMAVPDADKNVQLAEFVSHIRSSSELQALFDSVQHDPSTLSSPDSAAASSAAMMDLS